MTDPERHREELRISCADALELMTDLLEEALGPADADRMRAHLANCEPCSVFLDQLRATIRVAGQTAAGDEYPVDPDRVERLAELFRGHREA